MYLEPLEDALTYEGYRVLKARDVSTAIDILKRERIDVASVDVMLSPGPQLENVVASQQAGVYLCERIAREFSDVNVFCLSVVNDPEIIKRIKRLGIPFLRKGETPLRTVLNLMRSKLTGIAYSTERDADRWNK